VSGFLFSIITNFQVIYELQFNIHFTTSNMTYLTEYLHHYQFSED